MSIIYLEVCIKTSIYLIFCLVASSTVYLHGNIMRNVDTDSSIIIERMSENDYIVKKGTSDGCYTFPVGCAPFYESSSCKKSITIYIDSIDTLNFSFSTEEVDKGRSLEYPEYNRKTRLLSYAFTGDKEFMIMDREIKHTSAYSSVSVLGVMSLSGEIIYEKKGYNNDENYILLSKSYTDNAGNTIFAAEVKGQISLDGIDFYSGNDKTNLFICKLDPSGELIRKSEIEDVKEYNYDLLLTETGNLFVMTKKAGVTTQDFPNFLPLIIKSILGSMTTMEICVGIRN